MLRRIATKTQIAISATVASCYRPDDLACERPPAQELTGGLGRQQRGEHHLEDQQRYRQQVSPVRRTEG